MLFPDMITLQIVKILFQLLLSINLMLFMLRIISKRNKNTRKSCKCVQESLIHIKGVLFCFFFFIIERAGFLYEALYNKQSNTAVLSLTAQSWCPDPEWIWLHSFWCLTPKWIWHNGSKKSLQLIQMSVSSVCCGKKQWESSQTKRSAAVEDYSLKLQTKLNWDGEKDATIVHSNYSNFLCIHWLKLKHDLLH